MSVSASQVFDALNQHPACNVERHEIASTNFGALRRSLRSIVVRLREANEPEAQEVSDRLRMLLSEWLTVPIPFDDAILSAIQTLGDPDAVGARWGRDIRTPYEEAVHAAQSLPSAENPVRTVLRAVIRELRAQAKTFKIYCHRRARPHFESLVTSPDDESLPETQFLHSVKDYREAVPFDVLVKVGPLRSMGWGSAPDALITAPRFHTLIQVVWAGCDDEPGFGYDPAAAPDVTPSERSATAANNTRGNGISWTTHVRPSGEDLGIRPGDTVELDDFKILREPNEAREKRPALLVQIDEKHGILYPPHCRILSFDANPDGTAPLEKRIAGETLRVGMFVIQPMILDEGELALRAAHGQFSQKWKARLIEENCRDPDGLCRRLRDAGVNLMHLHSAVAHWCDPPTTVIHAPQKRSHFERLIEVLEIDFDEQTTSGARLIPWWQYAWNEIRRSRGEAIQAGFQGQEIVEDQLLVILRSVLSDIRLKSARDEGFTIAIPEGHPLRGAAMFHKIGSIENGFLAPEVDLKAVRELNTLDQWRV
jgi:hypothetical protein